MDSTLRVECHIGLEEEKEQQLFFDSTGLAKLFLSHFHIEWTTDQ